MSSEEGLDFFSGIFVFNPLDDELHLERIKNNITSICEAANVTKRAVKIVVALNMSKIEANNKVMNGVGKKTVELILNLKNRFNFSTLEYHGINACAHGYDFLLRYGHQKTDAKYISIFADDYIMPNFWYDIISLNFKHIKDANFMMPATCFVSQNNLKYDIEYMPEWDVRVADKGDHKRLNTKTIYGGVKIDHINNLAKQFVSNGVIPYCDPPSFETTVFKRGLIDTVGYIHEEYFCCFYDNDYFKRIQQNKLKGYIAKNCFIFHYGKGATKALYKETADEKYKDSPVEQQLLSDVSVWNKRWNQSVEPWWGKK